MEQSEILWNITWAILFAVSGGLLAFVGKHAIEQLFGLLGVLVSPLRNAFNANSFLVLFLKARGVDANWENIDRYAETVADAIEAWNKAQTEAQPLAEPK